MYLRVKSSGSQVPSSDLDLAIIEASSKTVALEVIGYTLHVDTVRDKPRTWFALIAAASPFGIGLHIREV